MERKYSEDFHRPFMANYNPTLQQNQQLSSQNHPLQINGSQYSNFYQFQNPSQRHNLISPQQIQTQGVFHEDLSNLEDYFSRMNLNVYSTSNNNLRMNQSANIIDRNLGFNVNPDQGFGLHSNSNPMGFLGSQAMINSSPIFPNPSSQQRSKYSSLKELKGQVSSVAKDQQGCRFLQKKFENETVKREEIEMMLSEVKDQLHELMVHQYANYLIRKLFEAGNQEQKTELLRLLASSQQKFLDVCTNTHGTRAVQKFMERIFTREQKSILLSVLKSITLTLTNNDHGHHIIELCFSKFSNEDTKHLVDEIVKHCFDIATNKSGCFVLQQCMVHAKAEARERLLAKIIANTFVLSEHPYGNYVVQFVIEKMNLPHVTSNIIVQLGGCYCCISMNKYGSNVVEKCLNCAEENDRVRIIVEIMHDPDFLKVLQDPFGNYVIQTALNKSKGELHNALVAFIQYHFPFLHSHPFGNKVLARTKWRKNRVSL